MSTPEARVLDSFEPKVTFHTVPRDEVPPGYAPIHLRDLGQFFASPELLATFPTKDQGHAEFPEAVRNIFHRFQRIFSDVYARTIAEWEEGFRHDMHPWQEIAIWESWADMAEQFAAHLEGTDAGTREKRKNIVCLIMSLHRLTYADIRAIAGGRVKLDKPLTISDRQVREIAKHIASDDVRRRMNERREHFRKLIQGPGLPGPDRVPIDAFFDNSGVGANLDADFDPTDLVNAADIIIGVSRADGHEFLMYGRDVVERIAASRQPEQVSILRIEMDQETDDLERLCALLRLLKGRDDYRSFSESKVRP